MAPHRNKRKGKRYCYQTSMDVIGKRPAAELRGLQRLRFVLVEDAVIGDIRRMLRTPEVAAHTAWAVRRTGLIWTRPLSSPRWAQFDDLWKALIPAEQARMEKL